jgi:alpha-tubulin suppressor-like RCC1 family protein
VPELARSGVSALSLASNLGVAFAVKNGGVIAWGSNQHWQCNVPSAALNNVVKVEAGSYHAFALKSDGSLVAWGRANDYGWFGAMSVPPECQIGTVDVCSTHLQNLFLKDGRVYASGSENPPVPPAGTESGVSAIARGGGYPNGMALKDGRVIVWGSNAFGQADVPPEANSGVDAIASGNGFNIALKGGRVIAWGRNDFGQGSVPPSALEDVASVAGGYGFILAVKTTASVIQGVTPISGPSSGGTRVTIRGRNFANPTTVTFGGVAATNVVVISDSIIEATTPACFPGPALVTVGQGSAQAFYYRPSCGTDANNDGVVDGNDLGILLSEWGPCE